MIGISYYGNGQVNNIFLFLSHKQILAIFSSRQYNYDLLLYKRFYNQRQHFSFL